jgi:ribonuclease J
MPQRPEEDYVRVVPLGGLETFGMNCCLVEHAGSMLMFDCGIAFPDSRNYGIDYYLPDWSYALENADILDGIVLTHAHEDHIGAMPFLLSNLDVPVYSGRLTLHQVRRRLDEWGIKPKSPFVEVEPRDVFEIGPFELEFIHVNHSVANAMSVAIGTSLGHLLFTGDWKIDHTPIGEPVADLPALARLGDDGVLAIVGDSTNALVPGSSGSERDVQRALHRVISEAPARVIIGQFSSNVPRIRGLVETANRLDRKIALLGRSLNQMVEVARETGFLKLGGRDPFISADEIRSLPDERLIICATGSQAEPRSSLARIARGDHHQVSLAPDDTVVISARQIPGNEAAIQSMLNSLVRRGATVITQREAPVHTSGHAYSEEMKLLMNLTRPDFVVPVHGEHRMRLAHANLAEAVGFESRLIEDGDVLEFTSSVARVIDRIPIGRVVVDGKLFGDVDDVQLRDRRKLAYTGMIVAFAVLDRSTGELASGPDLIQRGFLAEDEEAKAMLEEATRYAHEAVQDLSPDARSDAGEVGEALRTSVRRFFRRRIDRKPVVVPVVHEL